MEEISSKITEWLIKQQVIQRDDMEIYQYGLFHMIMNFADIISIILKGKSKIDTVAIMMHGKYYALIIDEKNKENVVANDAGLAASDEDATPISSLQQKNIQTLHFYSCNAGLLDAIHCKINKSVKETEKKFTINHNVAMAFYKLGKIDEITAYDGSVAFTANKPRLSNDQASAFKSIIELQPFSNVKVERYDGKVSDYFEYLKRPIQNGPYLDKTGICPNGEVKYVSSSKLAVYTYFYKHVTKIGPIERILKIRAQTHIKF